MVIANFENDSHPIVYGASQWNYGEVLRIQGLNLPKAVEIHFSLEKTAGQAIPRIGTTKDGVTDVVIPDSLLENEGELQDYFVYVWIYLTDATSGRTEHSLSIKVKARSKPEIPGGDDNADPFREAIKAVNDAADRAEESEQQAAQHAEQTKSDAIKTGEDRTAIEEMVESVSGISEQVQIVKDYKEQAQTASTNALLSEQKSEQAKESALQAQAGAETAERMAEQHALEVAGDKAEVERLATQVRQDKDSVEQTVQGFEQKTQQAVESVNTAKTQGVNAINTAKEEAVKAVADKGTEQTGNVTAEGAKQVEAVEAKGQEVMKSIPEDFTTQMQSKLDKQQGAENKGKALVVGEDGNVVPGEVQGSSSLKYAIKENATGNTIIVTDSAEERLQDFTMQGKTEQEENPSIESPKEIVNAGDDGQIEVQVTGKNLFDISKYDKYDDTWTNTTYTTKKLKLRPNTTYTMSCKRLVDRPKQYVIFSIIGIKAGEGISAQIKPDLSLNYFRGKGTFTTDETGEITLNYYVDVPKDQYWFTEVIGDIQIELGTEQTEYEPYRESQTVILQFDRPITKWDKIEKRDGVWGVACQTGHIQSYNGETVTTEYISTTGGLDTGSEIYYKLSKEEFVQLPKETQTALNNLHTYYPTTAIANSEDCEMEVEYVADTKNYIDNKISANVASIISQYQTNVTNLLSLMPLETQATMIENDTNNILEDMEVTK